MAELALFFSAFLAATVLPFSSEAALVVAISNGMNPNIALVVASIGNILAIVLNYLLGYSLYLRYHKKIRTYKTGRAALLLAHKHGLKALVFSWLPIIGDPITLAAGIVRLPFVLFFVITAFFRIMRYFLLIYFSTL